MRKLAIIWLIVAGAIAVVTTILQIEPALTFIEMTAGSDGRFVIAIPLGLTFIISVLPLFLVMGVNNFIQNRKNKVPTDLTGKTGIIIKRERELPNAALGFGVYINDLLNAKVGMGKSIFVELPAGKYELQIKLSKKLYSESVSLQLESGTIMAFSTKSDFGKSLTTIIPKGPMLFLVRIPFQK